MSAAALRDDFLRLVRTKAELLADTRTQLAGHGREQEALDHFFESTFLDVVTRFEAFIEDLFYDVALRTSNIYGAGPVPAIAGAAARVDLESSLLSASGDGYLKWLPITNTEARARVLLRDGRPFSRLERRDNERALMTEVMKVRNAIAHRSGDAWQKFSSIAPGPAGNGQNQRTPAAFLRMTVGAHTKYDAYCGGLGGIARALTARSDKDAWRLLGPESPRPSGDRAPAGSYRCMSCNQAFVIAEPTTLDNCHSCHAGPCFTCGRSAKSQFRRDAP